VSYVAELAAAIRAELPEDLVPEVNAEPLFLLYALLALVKGADVNGEDVHDAWAAWMTWRGEAHDSLVPFVRLPASTKAEDDPYVAAIRRVARRYREPRP
jgi:hypothetical protein